jgi:hypothetical protein
MAIKVVVKDDLIIGKHDGVFGVVLPKVLSDVDISKLRFLNGQVFDASDYEGWFIDSFGVKHIVEGDGWQELECHFDDALVLNNGAWRVRNDADDYADFRSSVLSDREAAYKTESDPLYMEWQYDGTAEAEQKWRDKVAEIKERYPLPTE